MRRRFGIQRNNSFKTYADTLERMSGAGAVATPGGTKGPLLTSIGCGEGGVDELYRRVVKHEASGTPMVAMVRFTVGQGTFKRDKILMLHCVFDSVPTIKRAKAGAKKGEIQKQLGEVNLTIEARTSDSLQIDNLLAQVGKSMASDSGSSSISIAKLKEDYEAMIRATTTGGKKSPRKKRLNLSMGTGRKTASELGRTVRPEQLVEQVLKDKGAFNWGLFAPTEAGKPLQMINAGSLSVLEMKRFLKDDTAAVGVLRLGFGSGKFRRTKLIFFTYVGKSAPIAAKAKLTGCKTSMKAALGHYHVEMQAATAEELSLEAVIAKVKASTPVDGDEVSSEELFSIDNFMQALAEEAEAEETAEFWGDVEEEAGDAAEDEGAEEPPRPVLEVCSDIRKGVAVNWGLFRVNV